MNKVQIQEAGKELIDILENPGKYVVIERTEWDDLMKTIDGSNRSLLWLKQERDRLIQENEELMHLSDEVVERAQTLKTMYGNVIEENTRLRDMLDLEARDEVKKKKMN